MKRIISVILAAMMLLMIAPTAAHGKRAESRAPYGYMWSTNTISSLLLWSRPTQPA